jgi:hypothetical protein
MDIDARIPFPQVHGFPGCLVYSRWEFDSPRRLQDRGQGRDRSVHAPDDREDDMSAAIAIHLRLDELNEAAI